MRDKILQHFADVYTHLPALLSRAPGRVNLIGEHTDYNDGFVLPFAIDRAVWIAVRPRSDNEIHVYSMDFGEQQTTFTVDAVQDTTLPHWTAYIRGAWWLLAEKGYRLGGAEVLISSDLPIGGGMSSSAAISVAAIEIALALMGDTNRSQSEKALLAVEIERRFVGVPVGVMDQMASAVPRSADAMLLDCRSLETSVVPLPEDAAVMVIDSRKARQLVGSPYAERRQQCEQAAKIFGVSALRDVSLDMVNTARSPLSDVQFRRARHVVTENARTLQAQTALFSGDIARMGELLNASHASLRDDYEVSVRELDVLTAAARQHPGCYGARIMGGGFGGCAVALVKPDDLVLFESDVAAQYNRETGLQAIFYHVKPAPGSYVEVL
jgi:galactokinase